jgi:hypothetical protein
MWREARSTIRAVGQSKSLTQVRIAQADDSTDLAVTKLENLSLATGTAMQHVARVARIQRELEQLAPEISMRLNFLVDDHLLGCSELLADFRRDLRRNR